MKRISGKTSLVLSLAIILFLSFGFTSLYSYIDLSPFMVPV